MSIYYFQENIKRPSLKFRLISIWLNKIIALSRKQTGNLSYIFCDNNYLLSINKQFLAHDSFTDIITFDYVKDDLIEGDIFISCEMVKENSKKYNVNLKDEFLRVISHGLLHLLGYKDKTAENKRIMRGKEEECILLYKEIENDTFKL